MFSRRRKGEKMFQKDKEKSIFQIFAKIFLQKYFCRLDQEMFQTNKVLVLKKLGNVFAVYA